MCSVIIVLRSVCSLGLDRTDAPEFVAGWISWDFFNFIVHIKIRS